MKKDFMEEFFMTTNNLNFDEIPVLYTEDDPTTDPDELTQVIILKHQELEFL